MPRASKHDRLAQIRACQHWIKELVAGGPFASPTALAREAGVDPSMVNRLLSKGENLPRLDTLQKLAAAADQASPTSWSDIAAKPGLREADAAYVPKSSPSSPVERQIKEAIAPRDNVATMRVLSAALDLEGLLPGDRIVVDQGGGATPEEEDLVIVNWETGPSGEAETLIRKIEGDFLVPHSSERGHRTLQRSQAAIHGVIIASYRLPRFLPSARRA